MIERLKNQDLLSYIENQTGQKAIKAGTNTYRFKNCPLCGNGDHFNVNPAKNLYNTFGNCGAGSIIDFEMTYKGIDQNEAIKDLYNFFHINTKKESPKTQKLNLTLTVNNLYKEFYHNNNYFADRLLKSEDEKISKNFNKIISKNKFFVAETSKLPKDFHLRLPKDLKKSNNLMIGPVWENSQVVNLLLKDIDIKSLTYNMSGYPTKMFNIDYLKDPEGKNIFITEGFFDCLSFEMLDYNSISINSVNMRDKFLEVVKENIKTCHDKNFIIAFDNDNKGIEAKNIIMKNLKDIGIRAIDFEFDKNYNDINDIYLKDLISLKNSINNIFNFKTEQNYILNEFISNINDNRKKKTISTGIKQLDILLNGGIYPGLYVLGAISSLGKTAITLQLSDNIAFNKNNVLFFSLEMPKDELLSRSISRKFAIKADEEKKDEYLDVSTLHVLNNWMDFYKDEFKEILTSYANNEGKYLKIIQGNFNYSIDDIISKVKEYINFAGKNPCVFIDYLQIIKPSKDLKFCTEKQCIDDIIVKLKMLSRNYKIPVFLVSSFNRENYLTPVSFSSFKESGGIEYTADFMIGLELAILKNTTESNKVALLKKVEIAKKQTDRDIRLKILKNRNGKTGTELEFKFYARNNYFMTKENYFDYTQDEETIKNIDKQKELNHIKELDNFVNSIVDDFRKFPEFKQYSTKTLKKHRLKQYLFEKNKTFWLLNDSLIVDKLTNLIKCGKSNNNIDRG